MNGAKIRLRDIPIAVALMSLGVAGGTMYSMDKPAVVIALTIIGVAVLVIELFRWRHSFLRSSKKAQELEEERAVLHAALAREGFTLTDDEHGELMIIPASYCKWMRKEDCQEVKGNTEE